MRFLPRQGSNKLDTSVSTGCKRTLCWYLCPVTSKWCACRIFYLCPYISGGGLPVTWYTGMCHGLEVPFQQFWYREWIRPIFQIWCIFEVFTPKTTNWAHFATKLSAFCDKLVYWWVVIFIEKRYRDSQTSKVSVVHPRTNFYLRTAPPPRVIYVPWARNVRSKRWNWIHLNGIDL